MSYFAELTPHTYTETGGLTVLNVGWLDAAYPFLQGETSTEFHTALRNLCQRPILLHRGLHACQFCVPDELSLWPTSPSGPSHRERYGNGQIRIQGADGIWYAAPTMVHHYVTEHRYLPPKVFIDAALHAAAAADNAR
jgi:hypothetical protein